MLVGYDEHSRIAESRLHKMPGCIKQTAKGSVSAIVLPVSAVDQLIAQS